MLQFASIQFEVFSMNPPSLFVLLAEPIRWSLVQALTGSDLQVHELARAVHKPLNLVSYHLRLLREAGVVQMRRSSLDGRATYCTVDQDRLRQLYVAAGRALCPPLGVASPTGAKPLRVLFLCTHNAARSQMAEGLLRAAVDRRWRVASAGSEPSTVHRLAISTLADRGIDISAQRSKDPSQLRIQAYDLVITLCDRVRAERIRFSNHPRRAHWSLPDPLTSPHQSQPRAFRETADQLGRRIGWLLQGTDQPIPSG